MKTIIIASIVTSAIILFLIAIAINLEDPLKANYRNVVKNVMEKEHLNAEKAVLQKHQYLVNAKAFIAKADQLRAQIASKTSGPAPMLTKTDMKYIEQMKLERSLLRLKAQRLLKEMNPTKDLAVAH